MHVIQAGISIMKRLLAGSIAGEPGHGNFVILAKSGISTVPPSAITGNIGVSPINSTAITGFALSLTADSPFATSTQVTGNVYAPDYAAPTPANLTTAIGDMQTAYTDIAVTPLAIPMLAGPGAISTVILLQNEARDIPQRIALYGCIMAVSLTSYLILRISARGARWLSPIVMSIAIRIMGLLLAAVAIQFMLNAIKSFRLELIGLPPT